MATREEIAEGIAKILDDVVTEAIENGSWFGVSGRDYKAELLSYLHDNDVVIKVEPKRCCHCDEGYDDAECTCTDPDPIGTMYTLVEPLMEVSND